MSTPPNQPPLPLPPSHVHVWRFSLAVDPPALAACWPLLSPDEQQRAQRFAFPKLRRRFVVARANLRQLLASYSARPPEALRFNYGPAGKPELSTGNWHFNVSHSEDQALIALAVGGPVGIDLERIRPLDYQAVARTVLPETDRAILAHSPPSSMADQFFRLWVRHEARTKAIGAPIDSRPDLPVYDLDVGPDYRAAVATAIKDVRIELFHLYR